METCYQTCIMLSNENKIYKIVSKIYIISSLYNSHGKQKYHILYVVDIKYK